MKKDYLFIIFVFFALSIYSQSNKPRTLVESGTSTYIISKNDQRTIQQIYEQVLNDAKKNAIDNAFPAKVSTMSQGSSSVFEQNGNIQSSSNYTTLYSINNGGYWIKDANKPQYSIDCNNAKQEISIICTVKGKIRERNKADLDIKAKTLDCDKNKNCQTSIFKHKQNMYLYFSSPVSGYMMAFLQNSDTIEQLIPYTNLKNNFENIKIEDDKDYYFFSDKYNYFNNDPWGLSPIQMRINDKKRKVETNTLIIVFSTKAFTKPKLDNVNLKNLNDNIKSLKPKQTSLENFQNWLGKNIGSDDNINPIALPITIIRPD